MSPLVSTIPCRSASVSLANAMSNFSFIASSRSIGYFDEQSIRILPSQSRGMVLNVGSTVSSVTVRSSLNRSARPIMDGSTAKRIDSDLQSSGSNGLEINDRGQLFDVLTQIIVGAR